MCVKRENERLKNLQKPKAPSKKSDCQNKQLEEKEHAKQYSKNQITEENGEEDDIGVHEEQATEAGNDLEEHIEEEVERTDDDGVLGDDENVDDFSNANDVPDTVPVEETET